MKELNGWIKNNIKAISKKLEILFERYRQSKNESNTGQQLPDQPKSQTDIKVTMEISAAVAINLKNLLFGPRAFI